MFTFLLLLICIFQLSLLLIWSIQHDIINVDKLNENYEILKLELKNKQVYGINSLLHDFFHKDSLHDSYKPAEVIYRVAIIIVYTGPALPSWFNTFAFSAQSSSSLYDWYIFVTDADIVATPPNVYMIKITEDDIATRICKLDNKTNDKDKEIVLKLLRLNAYFLVEFKPCLGYMFSDYIENYSHWGYGDVDILIGRIHEVIPIQILNQYDIYTSSFGDNFRLYMRGQLTINRNDPYINNLWRSCLHLSNIQERLRAFANRKYDHWNFQSAEGCYSRVVADHKNNVSVLVGATQVSDATHDELRAKESFYLGNALLRCYTQPAKLNDVNRIEAFLDRGIDSEKDALDFKTIGLTKPINEAKYTCSYWVLHEFQTCLDTVPAQADILIDEGKIEYTTIDRYKVLDTCREGAIAHFQGWKRTYYVFTTRSQTPDSNSMLITEAGFIPFKVNAISPDFESSAMHGITLPYGRITFKDIEDSIVDESNKENGRGRGWILPRISVDQRDWKKSKIGTSYCGGFTKTVQQCQCFIMGFNIEIVQVEEKKAAFHDFPITLITVATTQEFYSKLLDNTLNSWPGPKILVLSHHDAIIDLNVKPHRNDVTIIEVDISKCGSKDPKILLDNTLFNIGLDASPTDLVLLAPGGLIFAGSTKKLFNEYIRASKSSSVPVSFVIPTYTETRALTTEQRQSLMELEESGQKSSSAIEEHLVQYPPPGSKCSSQQSENLYLDASRAIQMSRAPEGKIDYAESIMSVKIRALDLIKSNTMMVPVLFNVSAGLHGKGFVRLPEELSGIGCFGSMIVRILAGSGFKVLWSPTFATVKGGWASGDCSCAFGGSDPNTLLTAASKFNQFFWRAVELRKYGLSSVAATKRFGENFEKEQMKLLKEKNK